MSWRYSLGFVVFLILFDIALDIYATAQLNHQLDLIGQKGEPLTLEELVPPPATDEKDVTSLYRRAQTKIHFQIGYIGAGAGDPVDKKFPSDQKTIPAYSNQKKTAAYLAKNAKAIELIRQASAEPKCRFDLHLNPYRGARVRHVNDHDLMAIMSLQAIYEAHTGNTTAALQDVHHLFLIAHQFSTVPSEMSLAKTYVKILRSDRTLSKVLLYAKISPTQARAFESSLPAIDLKPLAYRDFLVDRITSINGYQSSAWPYLIFNDNFPAETSLLTFRGILKLITTPLQNLDETRTLKLFPITYQRYLKTPFPMPPKYRDTQVERLDTELYHMPLYMIGTRHTFYPIPSKIPGDLETHRRERVIALALAAYRTQYHRYPTTLTSLGKFWGKALPKDLYGGKVFRYHSNGKTFHLYSIGNNRIDDGGKVDLYPGKDDIEWQNNSSLY